MRDYYSETNVDPFYICEMEVVNQNYNQCTIFLVKWWIQECECLITIA